MQAILESLKSSFKEEVLRYKWRHYLRSFFALKNKPQRTQSNAESLNVDERTQIARRKV